MKIMVLQESMIDDYGYDLMESAKELKNQLVKAINKNPEGEVILKIIQQLENEFNASKEDNTERQDLLKVAKYYVNWLKKSEKISNAVSKEIKQFTDLLNQIETQLNKSSMSDTSKKTIMDYYFKKLVGYIEELKKKLNKNKEILKSKDMMQQYRDKKSTEDANAIKDKLKKIDSMSSTFYSRYGNDISGTPNNFIKSCFKCAHEEMSIPEMKETGGSLSSNKHCEVIIKFDKTKNIIQKAWMKWASKFSSNSDDLEFNKSKSSSSIKVFDNILTPFASDEEIDNYKINLIIDLKNAIITIKNERKI